MQIQTILDQIDLGAIALPEFQRGYVWNRDQVRGLMDSLYRKHPVGSLLVWVTKTDSAVTRSEATLQPGSVKLLLDGQQRITSLYGIIRGKPPKFFDGDTRAFTGLYFNLEEEVFEFYAPLKMKDNPLWIDVTHLMKSGIGPFIGQLYADEALRARLDVYSTRLAAIDAIKQIDLHIEEVTGEDKTVDVVVDIFNRVNSGGTKLSKGDLALAKVCAEWPEARQEMKARLDKWRKAGYRFKLDWLLRCINTVITGEASFTALKDVDSATFRDGLVEAEKMIDKLLNVIASRLGLDHDRVLSSRYAFPVLVRYLAQNKGKFTDHQERDKLLYWYVHTFLWGRYSGSTESVLNQDLALIEERNGALDRLIEQLRQNRGDLRLHPDDFRGWSRGARFYPLLYMLTRVWHAKDWETGVELSSFLLGHLSRLQVHHIFPRALLYNYGYSKADVNAVANFTFLTQETNLRVSDRNPAEYLAEFEERNPGVIESHWIPMDRDLWKVENYPQFLAARRELLAKGANDFLDSLLLGVVPETTQPMQAAIEPAPRPDLGSIADEAEEEALLECMQLVSEYGLPDGELVYELVDERSGEVETILDLAWPNGLQEGFSQPVAVLLNESAETIESASRAGFRCFTDIEAFKRYVLREVLAIGMEDNGDFSASMKVIPMQAEPS